MALRLQLIVLKTYNGTFLMKKIILTLCTILMIQGFVYSEEEKLDYDSPKTEVASPLNGASEFKKSEKLSDKEKDRIKEMKARRAKRLDSLRLKIKSLSKDQKRNLRKKLKNDLIKREMLNQKRMRLLQDKFPVKNNSIQPSQNQNKERDWYRNKYPNLSPDKIRIPYERQMILKKQHLEEMRKKENNKKEKKLRQLKEKLRPRR